jgi:hypothetical protein
VRRAQRLAATSAVLALLLPLAGCGKYGKPVRKSRTAAASFAPERASTLHAISGAPQYRIEDAEEKKAGDR